MRVQVMHMDNGTQTGRSRAWLLAALRSGTLADARSVIVYVAFQVKALALLCIRCRWHVLCSVYGTVFYVWHCDLCIALYSVSGTVCACVHARVWHCVRKRVCVCGCGHGREGVWVGAWVLVCGCGCGCACV